MADAEQAISHNLPPFPPLVWQHYWQGETLLSAWAGFQSRQGRYGARSSSRRSDGRVHLYIASRDKSAPTHEQSHAFTTLLKEQINIRDAILESIFEQYPEWRRQFKDFLGRELFAEVMPKVKEPMGLRKVLGLHCVHILREAHNGVSYTGYEFGCGWDEEHGLGVMTHGNRVVAVGSADTAFDESIARANTPPAPK